jgi:hypothetical protein
MPFAALKVAARFWQLGLGLVLAVAAGAVAWEQRGNISERDIARLELAHAQAIVAEQKARADMVEAQRRINEEIVAGYVARIGDTDRTARDLARRLRDALGRGCPGVPGAGPAGSADAPGEEPGNGEALGRVVEDHIAACAADAEQLTALQEWARSGDARRD